MVVFSGSMVTASPLLAACGGGGPTFDEWAATDGAAGRINLEEVQEAFKISESATDFERRVNEIYEGDGVIYIRARQDGDALTLEGWEDLNNNNEIDASQDDKLFDIVKDHGENNMRGYGSNGYYRSSFGAGDFLFTYLLLSSLRGPYFYHTPVGYGDTLRRHRTSYRQSPRYSTQVSKNSRYFSRQKSFAGSRYNDAGRNLSSSRRTYQQTQRTSGTFKQSSAVGRSSSGTVRSSSGSYRGGGGSQVVIGRVRAR
jgi:hypothetical protein